jgi:hypothetical protein
MADVKISGLTIGDPAQAGDQVPVNRGGANFSVTAGTIAGISVVIPGRDGEDGDQGYPGVAGADGAPGIQGPQGLMGMPGVAGDDGDPGFSIPGPQGIQGFTGANGVDGQMGIPGIAGEDGEPGYPIPGPQGIQGVIGNTGASGSSGPRGADGADGEDFGYFQIIPPSIVFSNQSNVYAAGTVQDFDTARAKFWGSAPIFDPTEYAGADMCAKIAAVFADAAFASGGIIDARGFTGDQNCGTQFGSLAAMSYKLILGRVKIHSTVKWNIASGAWTSVVAVPSAPALATSTTGGSLAATTQWGVVITLVNGVGETTRSTESLITTGAGATNKITVTSPTANFNATCYNVRAKTPAGSGWLLSNITGCIPIGQNYDITTIPAGSAAPSSNTAVFDTAVEIEGQGESSIISLEANAAFIQPQNNNVYLHNFAVTSTQTSSAGSGSIVVAAAFNFVIDRIFISGGGAGIYVDSSNDGRIQNIRYGKPTFGPASAVAIAGSAASNRIAIQNIDIEPSVYPTTASYSTGVGMAQCVNCSVDRVRCSSLDMSQSTFGACLAINGNNTPTTNTAYINASNIQCDSLIWADCIAVTGFAHDINIDNFVARHSNTQVGITGLNTFQQGDCLDIFMSSRVRISNGVCEDMNTLSHGLPSMEVFNTYEVSISNVQADDGAAGIRLFGAPATNLSNVSTNRNWNTGYQLQDFSALVTCNGTTSVVWVSGGGGSFGPWPAGTNITINGVAHQIASITDSTHLVTAANCTTGASVTMILPTTDISIVNPKADDNGMNAVGTGSRTGTSEGIFVQGGTQFTILGGSANDNKATASKTQQYGLRITGTARGRIIGFDGSNNVGAVTAPCTGIEYGANVAGNHAICDDVKTSPIFIDDSTAVTDGWAVSHIQAVGPNNKNGQAAIVANVSGINTTETVIVKSTAFPANRLIAGTHIRVTLTGTCTATVANTSTFTLRWGTAGTTADGAICTPVTAASGTGTTIPFKVVMEFTVRVPGAAATSFSDFLIESLTNGMIGANTLSIIQPTMSAFNSTTALGILSLTYKTAATTTTSTFNEAVFEIVHN